MIKVLRKYKPLIDIAEGKIKGIDTVIVTGGRNSFKSYHISLIAAIWFFHYNFKILYSRYTWAAAKDSIVEEINEKINILGFYKLTKKLNDRFVKSKIKDENEKILNNSTTPQIVFKGIKTSSGNQTANLKSLKNFNAFIVDEGEEQPSYGDWRKVKRSLRRKDLPNIAVVILNPTPKTHWVYREFFEKKGVPEGFNGIKDNILYIHSIYTDNLEWVTDENLRDFEETKTQYSYQETQDYNRNPDIKKIGEGYYKNDELILSNEYKYTILGGFREKSEGVIFRQCIYGEFPKINHKRTRVFGLDFGNKDPNALIEIFIDKISKILYLKEWIYETGQSQLDLYNLMSKLNIKGNDIIYADSSRPDTIKYLRQRGLYVKPFKKYAGSVNDGIDKINKYKQIIIQGKNMMTEANMYCWADKIQEVPIDEYNHGWDAVRYALPFAEKI